jgi:hypothetical protein
MLSNSRQNMHRQPVRLWKIDSVKLDTGLHQIRYERHIAGEAIKLGNDQRSTMEPAEL